VTPNQAGSISNTASVSSNEADPDLTNNTDTESTTVNPQADLAISKDDTPDPVLVGNNLTYQLTVTNSGPSPATGVIVNDPLPGSVAFVSASPSQGSCSGTSTVTCNLGSLASGSNATITIVVRPTQTGTITNTASVSGNEADPTPANNTATAMTTVNPQADLIITKADTPDPVLVGNNLTYLLTVTNNGPSAATNVTVNDPLPPSVTFVSASPSQGSCSGTSTVTCTLGSLASGSNATVTIVVRPTQVGTLSNTASVTGSEADPNTANNTATAPTTVSPKADLAIIKTDTPDPVKFKTNLTYTIRVTNNGPSPATGVTVTDPLPGSVTFVSATPSQGSCSGTSTVTCTLGSLASGSSATITLVVTPNQVGQLTNTVGVTGSEADPNTANNSATAVTTVQRKR
jgi:uncharacterized repeat protein (TIGR01451 family)